LLILSEQDATQEECTYTSRACPQEIFFLDTNGVFLGKAAGFKQYITSIDWSPDSQYLAVIVQKDESDEMFFYNPHSQTFTPFIDLPGRLESIYNTGSSMFRLWSFSFSPGGYNGVFCATEDTPSTEYRGCYLVGLDGEWLFTLVRGEIQCISPMLSGSHKHCPTKCTLDAGDSAAFSSIFLASVFPAPKQSPRPPQRQ